MEALTSTHLIAAGLVFMVTSVFSMLGVGGGFLIAPMLLARGFATKRAVATTSFIVTLVSVSGFVAHAAAGRLAPSLTVLTLIERRDTMLTEREILMNTLEFHGHRCWASVAGVRVGLAALRVMNVNGSGGRQLHAFVVHSMFRLRALRV